MQLRHALHRRSTNPPATDKGNDSIGARVPRVHRMGASAVAVTILTFGLLGFAGGLPFFSTSGQPVLGMSSNGLLSTVSVVTAIVLITAALRGPRIASTVMTIVGALFLVSALANLAVLRSELNFLAFEMSNVAFSVAAGLALLLLGAYGRFTGHLPPDSPYARSTASMPIEPPDAPSTPAEFAAERAMREAEIAVVNRTATPEQRRRVAAMAEVRTRPARRQVWMEFDRRP